jgi:STE24 endopeptidase
MPFVLLLLAFLLYAQEGWAPPRFDLTPRDASLFTLAGMGAFVIVAGVMSLTICHSLHLAAYDRYAILKRFSKWRRWHFFGFAGFFVASLYVLGWGWAVESFLGDSPLVKLLVLLPFLSGLILSWGFFYDVDRASHAMLWLSGDTKFPSRSSYLALTIRHNFMLMAPPLVLMTAQDFLQNVFPDLKNREEFPLLTLAVLGSLMAASIVFSPLVLRLFLGLTPLPPGELRDHLAATARRLNFRYSDVLVWNTRRTIATAMVIGTFPLFRYIIFTDRLIEELSTDEIESVFGHEVGHIKHHHMSLYTLFLLLSLIMLGGLWDLARSHIADWGLAWPELAEIIGHQEWFLVVVVVYIFLVFGLLSRHCERQADLFGCHVATRDAFIRALEKVADLNGMSRERPGIFTAWQHWTIGQRVEFLRKLDTDPALEARAQRRIGLLKWSLTLALCAVVLVLLTANPWNWLKIL